MPSAPKLVSSRRVVSADDGFLEPAVKNLVMNLQSILAREKKNPACSSCGGSMRRALFEIIHAYDSGTTSARQVCHDCGRYAASREHDDEGEILYCVMVSFALPRPKAERLLRELQGRRGVVARNLGRLKSIEELREKY